MISRFSVKKPYTVLVGVVMVIVLGIVSFTKMKTDLLPNISLPYVIVMTTYAGASPETVETVVTKPVEASMATVSNIESVNSVSNESYSMVILEFAQSSNMDAASLEIREKLDQIKSYWKDDLIGSPVILKLNPDMMPVMVAAAGVEGMEMAEVSTYISEHIVPELESLEGVASVGTSGLIEQSVNIVIREEKIARVNEQIRAAIDEQMAEAEEELADGKSEIMEGFDKLADGKAEISKGQKELNDGKSELDDGKQELKDKQESANAELAAAKRDLLTAKSNLESIKTNLTTARTLQATITEITMLQNASATYTTAYAGYTGSVSGGDAAGADTHRKTIEALKESVTKSELLKTAAKADPSGQLSVVLTQLANMNWLDSTQSMTVGFLLQGVSAAGTQMEGQKQNLKDALNSATSGMGLAVYEGMISSKIGNVDEKLEQVNSGLVELEKGQLTAAVEFANANTQISLGEYQMDAAETSLDSAKETMKNTEEQLRDALTQIEDGEEQLSDAREDAYDKADMDGTLTVETISGLLAAQNFSMPAGYVAEEGISYMVRVGDKPDTVEELASMPLLNLHMNGVDIITLADVADVFYVDNSDEVYTNINGKAGIILSIQKQTGYSTGEVSDIILDRFDKLMETNGDLDIVALMDQGIYIDLVMDSIVSNVIWGALLAILILLVFLKDLRPTMVVAFSIPISLVTAVVCMYFSGVTLNIISLSGLALGIGMLVDNSIVVIENIYRLRSEGYSAREAAMEGARGVAGAIIASTLTTICVFAPIVFTEGITRQLFVDMGLTIAYSLVSSLVIALTVVPAMSSKLLGTAKEKEEGAFFTGMKDIYEKILKAALEYKAIVILGVFILLGGSVIAAVSNGTAFMPEMDSTQLTATITLEEGADIQEIGAMTDEIISRIREIEEVQDVGAMTGGSGMMLMGGSGGSNNTASLYITTVEEKKVSNEEIAAIILEKTADLDAEIAIETSSMDMTAMGGSGIAVRIKGRELDKLQQIATEVAAVIESVEGTAEVSDGMEDAVEELRIIVDRDKAMEYGLTVAQIFKQVNTRLAESSSATTLAAQDKDYGVYVIRAKDKALTRELLRSMEITGTGEEGESVKIEFEKVAEFVTAQSLNAISRMAQTRYIEVSASIAPGYNVGKVSTAAEDKLSSYSMPDGYSLEFAGENEMINDALEQVGLMLILALVFMYLIMVAQFQSLLSPFIIMFTIPLAFTGGLFGLFFTGSEVSVIAMIGFVMLAGIIVNNGIVLIDYMNQLREEGVSKREAILKAGRTRLRPVLMTALTTILALSVMVFSKDMGSEMMKPMAIVTIGGLVYGTLLTLVVIPCVYDILSRDKTRKEGKKPKKGLLHKKPVAAVGGDTQIK